MAARFVIGDVLLTTITSNQLLSELLFHALVLLCQNEQYAYELRVHAGTAGGSIQTTALPALSPGDPVDKVTTLSLTETRVRSS